MPEQAQQASPEAAPSVPPAQSPEPSTASESQSQQPQPQLQPQPQQAPPQPQQAPPQPQQAPPQPQQAMDAPVGPGVAFDMQQFFQAASQMQQQQQAPQQEPPQPQQQQQAGEPEKEGQPQDDIAATIEAKNKVPEHWGQYDVPQNVPAGEALKKMAHRMGLTQGQFEGVLHNMQTYNQAAKIAEIQTIRMQGARFIKEKWGKNAEYELNVARKALRTVDDNGQLQRLFDQTGYGNHPVVLNFFNKLGRQLKEGGFLRGSLRNPAGQQKTLAQRLFPGHPSNQ